MLQLIRQAVATVYLPLEGSGLALAAAAIFEKSGGVLPAKADTVIACDTPAVAACKKAVSTGRGAQQGG